jgi:hypothetical protein
VSIKVIFMNFISHFDTIYWSSCTKPEKGVMIDIIDFASFYDFWYWIVALYGRCGIVSFILVQTETLIFIRPWLYAISNTYSYRYDKELSSLLYFTVTIICINYQSKITWSVYFWRFHWYLLKTYWRAYRRIML